MIKVEDHVHKEAKRIASEAGMSLQDYIKHLISDHSQKKHRGTKVYTMWTSMRQRCTNPNNPAYVNYGERGITYHPDFDDLYVYKTYIESLDNAYEPGYSLDRKDNDRGYEPGNLRWATRSEQNLNQRVKRSNKTGYAGVSKHEKKFQASVAVNRKNKYLGTYVTALEAAQVRNAYIEEHSLPNNKSVIEDE